MALTKVTKELIQGSLSVEWQSAIKTSSFQSITGQGYFVNTTASAVTVTMPATANVGDIVSIVDYAGTAQTNNITITAALNINGSANDVKINYERGAVSIVYSGIAEGWVAEVAANDGTDALVNAVVPFTADYLIIAGGGGGGGDAAGGGGAGGLRTSYGSTSGGGVSPETQLTLVAGTNYTVTIGTGGAGSNVNPNNGASGLNSVFSTIESDGGSGGSGHQGTGIVVGGSGGGNDYDSDTVYPNNGTSNQGFGGGLGFQGSNPAATFKGGGGGGASELGGTNATGHGGDGLEVNIIGGTGNYYAGGGGGGCGTSYSSANPGGAGGGGAGAKRNASDGVDGTVNTGGGAGAGDSSQNPGDGGSGIVVLRYLTTSVASFAVTGTLNTPTPIIDGTYSVLRFTTGTGTITFS